MGEDLYKGEVVLDQNFYTPLCLSGYLTPLQRQKLREKRNAQLIDGFKTEESRSKKVKKPRVIKRKREQCIVEHNKCKERIKRTKESVSRIQCTAAKIVLKTGTTNEKDKKFFKTASNRMEKATFSMPLICTKNSFLNIDRCIKESLSYLKKKIPSKESNHVSGSLDSAGNSVAYDEEHPSENLVLYDSMNFDWGLDEMFLERQNKAREAFRMKLKTKEIRREKEGNSNGLSFVQEKCISSSTVEEIGRKEMENIKEAEKHDAIPMKLYPIFYMKNRNQSSKEHSDIHKAVKRKQNKILKDSLNGGEQMIIDAGQKHIGPKTCSTCSMIYSNGQEDESLHLKYHNMYMTNLQFRGWKDENVLNEYADGRVIMVKSDDACYKLKKVKDVLAVANRDLGISSPLPKSDLTIVMFVSNSREISGCLVAEHISSANFVLPADIQSTSKNPTENNKMTSMIVLSNSERVPAVCGVNRIWVAQNYRRKQVASRLVDCLRLNFIHGHVVGIRELAFTVPTTDGREFAAAYTKTDRFLVYK